MNALLEKELDDLEDILEKTEDIQESGRFKIKDLDSANWVFRKLKAIDAKIKEVTELANKEIEPYQKAIEGIVEWKDNEIKQFDRSINYFNFLLEEYYRDNKAVDPKFKLSTPYGKVSSRKLQPKWNYDNDKVIKWLLENDKDLVRVKYEPNKVEIKNTYKINGSLVTTKDGEIVEGITIEEQKDSITIKVVE